MWNRIHTLHLVCLLFYTLVFFEKSFILKALKAIVYAPLVSHIGQVERVFYFTQKVRVYKMRFISENETAGNNRRLPGGIQETIKKVLFSQKNIVSLTLILIKLVVGIIKKSKADN